VSRALPPLNPLRAFEAAARLSSFAKAAEELSVTRAAVSHHIRTLEDYLGFPLFVRRTGQMELTAQGATLLPVVQDSFNQVTTIVERLKRNSSKPALSLRLPPYLSAWWLTPRLSRFVQRFPEVELRLEHSVEPADFARGEIDLAVHWREPGVAGIVSEPLLSTPRVPMCAPKLLNDRNDPRPPSDIERFNLLHEFDYGDWEQWYVSKGLDPTGARRGTVVDNYQVMLRAAAEGQGVALLMSSIVREEIAASPLVAPFGADSDVRFVYRVLYPRTALGRPVVRAFRDWLFEEALPYRDLDQDRLGLNPPEA
jgi:LysR family transcriptional regulator, glycine cleavage system transcriptional activator